MKLHEMADEPRNQQMKNQLAFARMKERLDEQDEQIKSLKKSLTALEKAFTALVRKIGPR